VVFHVRALDGLGIVGEVGWRRHDELWCSDELAVGSLYPMRLQATHERTVLKRETASKRESRRSKQGEKK
jgi:hypothetical protein